MKKIKTLSISTTGCYFVSYENVSFSKLQFYFKKDDGSSFYLNQKNNKIKTDFEFSTIYKKKYIYK